VLKNKYGIKEYLVDGGTIATSPSLYAFEIAASLRDKENIRVLSIGTGTHKTDSNPKDYNNNISKLSLFSDLTYKIAVAADNEILNKTLGANFSRL